MPILDNITATVLALSCAYLAAHMVAAFARGWFIVLIPLSLLGGMCWFIHNGMKGERAR